MSMTEKTHYEDNSNLSNIRESLNALAQASNENEFQTALNQLNPKGKNAAESVSKWIKSQSIHLNKEEVPTLLHIKSNLNRFYQISENDASIDDITKICIKLLGERFNEDQKIDFHSFFPFALPDELKYISDRLTNVPKEVSSQILEAVKELTLEKRSFAIVELAIEHYKVFGKVEFLLLFLQENPLEKIAAQFNNMHDSKLRMDIMATAKEIAEEDRDKAIPMLLSLYKGADDLKRKFIHGTILDMPPGERSSFLESIAPYSIEIRSENYQILQTFSLIPEEERDLFSEMVVSLFKDINENLTLKDLIVETIRESPKGKRTDIIVLAESLLKVIKDPKEKLEAFKAIMKQPHPDRADIVKNAKPLLRNLQTGQDKIIHAMGTIPAPKRSEMAESAAPHATYISNGLELATILLKISAKEISKQQENLRPAWILQQSRAAAKGEALLQAIIKGDLEHFKKLIKIPEDFDTKDAMGNVPLINAAYYGRKDFVEFLLNAGADPKVWSTDGRPIHNALKRGFTEVAAILEKKEADPSIAKFFMLEKMLCHRFGTDYTLKTNDGTQVCFHGFDEEYTFPELCRSMDEFMKDPKTSGSAAETKAIWAKARVLMSKALENGRDVRKALVMEDIVVIPVRTGDIDSHRGHSTGIVVSKKLGLVIKCNRGLGSPKDKEGIELYSLPEESPSPLDVVFQELLGARHGNDGLTYFNKFLNTKLELKEHQQFHHKAQHGSNCTWASAKLDLRAVLYLLLLEKHSPDKAQEMSYKLYKEWTAFDRRMAIREFTEAGKHVDRIVESKGISNPKEEGIVPQAMLSIILRKCLKANLVEVIPELLDNYPVQLGTEFFIFDVFERMLKFPEKTNSPNEKNEFQALYHNLKRKDNANSDAIQLLDLIANSSHSNLAKLAMFMPIKSELLKFQSTEGKAELLFECNKNENLKVKLKPLLLKLFEGLDKGRKKVLCSVLLKRMQEWKSNPREKSELINSLRQDLHILGLIV